VADVVKTIRLSALRENPRVLLHKNWVGHVVMCTESPRTPMTVSAATIVTVPMVDSMGPVSAGFEVDSLRAAYHGPMDIYVIHCTTPAGVSTQGMIAVPKALKPVVEAV